MYICNPIKREFSSAGSEHLPYKQGVTGSNPVTPTKPPKGGFFIMHYLYIIHSCKIDRYYIGETMDLEKRLSQHNNDTFVGCFTRRSNDWKYKLTIEFSSKAKAQKAERFIKKMNSRKFVQNLIDEYDWLKIRFEND